MHGKITSSRTNCCVFYCRVNCRPRKVYFSPRLGARPQAADSRGSVTGHDGLVQDVVERTRRESGTPRVAEDPGKSSQGHVVLHKGLRSDSDR